MSGQSPTRSPRHDRARHLLPLVGRARGGAAGRRLVRLIHGALFQSLDGVIQAPGGPSEDPTGGFALGGWMAGVGDEAVGAAVGAFFDRPFALLLGRRTFDIFAGYWPHAGDHPFAAAFDAADKFVLTRGSADLSWANSRALAGVAAVSALRDGDGPDLLIQGSATLYPPLLAAGLIDRLTLYTLPVVLGRGKRWAGDGVAASTMRLVEHQVTAGGTTIATFAPGGTIVPGSFGEPPSNLRERARQAAIAAARW